MRNRRPKGIGSRRRLCGCNVALSPAPRALRRGWSGRVSGFTGLADKNTHDTSTGFPWRFRPLWSPVTASWMSASYAHPPSIRGRQPGSRREGSHGGRRATAVVGRCENFLHSSELPDRGFIDRPAQGSVAPESHPPGSDRQAFDVPGQGWRPAHRYSPPGGAPTYADATGLHAPDHATALTSRLSGPASASVLPWRPRPASRLYVPQV